MKMILLLNEGGYTDRSKGLLEEAKGTEVQFVSNITGFMELMPVMDCGMLISDLFFSDGSVFNITALRLDMQILLLTDIEHIGIAEKALDSGVTDYILRGEELPPDIMHIVRRTESLFNIKKPQWKSCFNNI